MTDLPAQLRAIAAARRSAGAGGRIADLLDVAARRVEDQDAQLFAANSYILRLLDRCDAQQQIIAAVRCYAAARDGAERATAWADVEDVLDDRTT